MMQLFGRALDLLYPRVCSHCARVGEEWCPACADELNAYPFELIERDLDSGLHVVAVGWHEGILRDGIHALKFDGAQHLAEPLGNALAAVLEIAEFAADLIVPVPLHAEREKWRGYNQSALLAETVSARLDVSFEPVLQRIRSTGTQVGRDADARWMAMDGAFEADSERVNGRRVLLIDDVVTTGSTLTACAAALLDAGAADVMAACVVSA